MRTKRRVGILLVSSLGLLGMTTPPAQATTVAFFSFTGTASVPGGLGYPCTDPTKPCPPPIDAKSGNTRNFGFASSTCLGTKTDIGKVDKLDRTYGPNCAVAASGTITGYCGLFLGTGLGIITWFGSLNIYKTVEFSFKVTDVAGTFVVDGFTKNPDKGQITVVADSSEDPTGGSCTNKTATSVIIAGTGTIVNPTVV